MERKKEKMDEENRIFFMFVQIVTLARTKFFLKKTGYERMHKKNNEQRL